MPYALVIFLMTIYTRTDVIMLERLLPDGDLQAGIYASAYRLLEAANALGLLFAGLLFPMFSRQLKEKMDVSPLVRFSFQLIMVAAVTLAATTWFFRSEIMKLLYKAATDFSGDVLGVLMGSFVAVSGTYIYSTLIGSAGASRRMNRTFIIAFVLNMGLNFVLIPPYKAFGAAISTLVTQSFVMFSLIFLSKKLNILRGDNRWSLRILTYAAAVFISIFFIKNAPFAVSWLVKMGVSVGVGGLLAVVFGLLDYRKLENLLKNQGV